VGEALAGAADGVTAAGAEVCEPGDDETTTGGGWDAQPARETRLIVAARIDLTTVFFLSAAQSSYRYRRHTWQAR